MRYALLLAAFIASQASAGTVNVDFESVAVEGEQQLQPGGILDGMLFVDPRAQGEVYLVEDGGCEVAGCSASGSTSLLYEGIHPEQPGLVLRHPGGLPFTLLGFDAAEAFADGAGQNATALTIRGHLAAGGIVEASISLDGIVDGVGGQADFESFSLASTPLDAPMSLVAFWGTGTSGRAGFGLDNLSLFVDGNHVSNNVLNVPEPSAFALAAFWLLIPLRYCRELTKSNKTPLFVIVGPQSA